MKKIFIMLGLVGLLSGCVSMQKGEARIMETRVVGMDLSLPIPGLTGQNIVNLKFGWVEVKYAHTRDVNFISNAKHKDINLIKGKGTIKRTFEITSDKK